MSGGKDRHTVAQAYINILALDTACGAIAACLLSGGRTFETESDGSENASPLDNGKSRSTVIVPILSGLLDEAGLGWDELELLALGAGPGSFTGLRIGAATLAGMNAGLKLPILHLSSLAITARQCHYEGPLHVLEDARAGELFYGCYDDGVAVEEDCCLQWSELGKVEAGAFCAHAEPPVALQGWQRIRLEKSRSRALAEVTKTACANLSGPDALHRYPHPAYLQLSQAERNANGA